MAQIFAVLQRLQVKVEGHETQVDEVELKVFYNKQHPRA